VHIGYTLRTASLTSHVTYVPEVPALHLSYIIVNCYYQCKKQVKMHEQKAITTRRYNFLLCLVCNRLIANTQGKVFRQVHRTNILLPLNA
jgi:hypothetical protein